MSLRNTLRAFNARLDDIAVHQEFISKSLRIGREASAYWNYETLKNAAEMKDLVNNHRKQCAQVRIEDICGALSVQLFAALEWFIGETLIKSVKQISTSVVTYEKLPGEISRTHVTLTGKALSKVYEAPHHERIDVDQVFRNLSGCINGSNQFELNDYVFAFYLPNIDSKNLFNCFLRIGLKLDWDEFGKNEGLQNLFGENSVRKTGKASNTYLDQCSKDRNSVAHKGDGSATIQLEDLSKQLTFFRHLTSSIAEQVEKYLNSLKP